ncbi:MAG: hypothetical protein ACKVP3_00475 [Hyphomicrobiaceae bacterium]
MPLTVAISGFLDLLVRALLRLWGFGAGLVAMGLVILPYRISQGENIDWIDLLLSLTVIYVLTSAAILGVFLTSFLRQNPAAWRAYRQCMTYKEVRTLNEEFWPKIMPTPLP